MQHYTISKSLNRHYKNMEKLFTVISIRNFTFDCLSEDNDV